MARLHNCHPLSTSSSLPLLSSVDLVIIFVSPYSVIEFCIIQRFTSTLGCCSWTRLIALNNALSISSWMFIHYLMDAYPSFYGCLSTIWRMFIHYSMDVCPSTANCENQISILRIPSILLKDDSGRVCRNVTTFSSLCQGRGVTLLVTFHNNIPAIGCL